ncbi:MAG: glycosyltransferase family 4 protein [Candidatus Rokubacteria bacterium]|nr:glycosyltransferase family 4 protein [Candidatus Rokubacteria bacterium]
MKVCYWGTYQRGYIRNQVILSGLTKAGVEVWECHVPVWQDEAEDKVAAMAGLAGRLRFLFRLLNAYPRLAWRFLRCPSPDAMFIGHLGHLDMLVAWPLARWRGIPIVFDAHLSLFDMVVQDRGLHSPRSWIGRICRTIDWLSCRLADRILLAEQATIEFFCREYGLSCERFTRVFVGANTDVFAPGDHPTPDGTFTVVHFGKYIPLHGMDVILHAAKRLEAMPDIRFRLIGQGQLYADAKRLAAELDLRNVEFVPWVTPRELREHIRLADVCLGIFGRTQKAGRVIPNKVYESLAMARPLITGDTEAARELLEHGRTALLCPMANPEALAQAILVMKQDATLRMRIGAAGYELFQRRCAPEVLGLEVRRCLELAIAARDGRGGALGDPGSGVDRAESPCGRSRVSG